MARQHNDRAMSKPRIAVIEDDDFQRELLTKGMNKSGYLTWGVGSAEGFYRRATINPVDIVIADVGLPGENGLSLLEHLSQSRHMGLICITADTSVETEATAWKSGIHLLCRKPLIINKMINDVDVLWKRISQRDNDGRTDSQCWILDAVSLSVTSPKGIQVSLTRSELAFLSMLANRPMEVVPNSEILSFLFGCDPEAKHRLEMLINRMRQKFKNNNVALPLRSVFGKGRVFCESILSVDGMESTDKYSYFRSTV